MKAGCAALEAEAEPISLGVGTCLQERGRRAFAAPRSAPERVRIYRTDTPQGRDLLQLSGKDPVADALFWYREQGALVAVELKGADLSHAVTQLAHTIQAVKRRLREAGCGAAGPRLAALVVYRGGAPPRAMQARVRDFRQHLNVRLEFQSNQGDVDKVVAELR